MYPTSRLRLIFLLFLSLFLLTLHIANPTTVYAQNGPFQVIKDKQSAIKNGANQESWLDEALGSNLVSGIRALGGDMPDNILDGQYNPSDPIIYLPGGALGSTNQLVSALYNPPASGIEYIAMLKDNLLGKPVYAQGVGFQGLTPLLPIWKTFRNLVYLLSSLIFIAVGLMVIFRVKVNPQTVVSFQNAIPQIFIALILVTFSYAIAGLLIDFVYLIQSLFIALLFNANGSGQIPLNQDLFPPSIFGTIKEFISKLPFVNIPQNKQLFDFESISNPGLIEYFGLVKAMLPIKVLLSISAILGAAIGGIVGALTLNPFMVLGGGAAGLVIGGPLIVFIIQVLILISLIRFFLGLVRAYITVLLKIILAPLEIGLGALPNSKLNFQSWFFDLVANLAVFPMTIIFVVVINLIIKNTGNAFDQFWAPAPIAVAGVINIIPAIIGLGAILLMPRLPDLIQQAVFQLKPSPWGTAIGEGLKPVTNTLRFAGQTGLQAGATQIDSSYKTAVSGPTGPSWGQKVGKGAVDAASFFGIIKSPK